MEAFGTGLMYVGAGMMIFAMGTLLLTVVILFLKSL